jgi:acyl-CoA synthetase (AMP-forming)/AMP-acid ligase II/1-acyl-sn-glycerol-3-phosphate acyltransferase/acyl carrier protein
MIELVRLAFRGLLRWLMRRRYKVEVIGLERLRELHGPTLVMPNHPGYIDPPMVYSHIRMRQRIRPVVTSGMYRLPLLYPLMRLMDALEVPELAEHSRDARQQTLEMIDKIVAGVERGESFLLYPSGRTQRGKREEIGAARSAAEILARCPQANVVLVRTRGLWGSMFTYARGKRPDLGNCALTGLKWMAANLILFAPRRKVTMTVEVIDRRNLPSLDRDKLNRYLEEWYNRGGPESPTFVRYHRLFGPRDYPFPDPSAANQVDVARIKPATIDAVNDLIAERLKRPLSDEERRPETTLEQLGLDSLERMDIALEIEDHFGFRSDRVADTLGQLWELAEGLRADSGESETPVPALWNRAESRGDNPDVLAETLAEAFVRRALLHPSEVAAADRVSGVLTYRRMLVGARLLSRRMAALPGDAVGVLLPASVAADLVFFGLHLVGKLPVMLNWTTGPANLAHAVATLGIRRVVTSRKLIDRLGIEIQGAEYVFLEDIKTQTKKREALWLLLKSYLPARRLLRRLPKPDVNAPAVVLFTSGSESLPKAVPLSHRNLISDVRGSLDVLKITRVHSMLGFLPPFHSFGLTGTVLAPILAGFRVVHHPDPTDAKALVRITASYRTTLLVTTPTFLSYMLAVAGRDDLITLETIITGAEKCPEKVFARTKQLAPRSIILEGYGITECSPVVAGNRPERIKAGTLGPPIAGVEVCVVDPDSHQPLPINQTGMLLIRGPSVFNGYLNYQGPDPFVEVSGKRWYVSGDLVQLDEDRYIHFRGRLKRFLKAGGEMISLPALEEPLSERFPPTENGPQVGVEGVETPEARRIVLFTTQDLSLREANAIVSEAGFRGVMRLDEVVRVDAIPVLGTGKTDYKALRAMVLERMNASSQPKT